MSASRIFGKATSLATGPAPRLLQHRIVSSIATISHQGPRISHYHFLSTMPSSITKRWTPAFLPPHPHVDTCPSSTGCSRSTTSPNTKSQTRTGDSSHKQITRCSRRLRRQHRFSPHLRARRLYEMHMDHTIYEGNESEGERGAWSARTSFSDGCCFFWPTMFLKVILLAMYGFERDRARRVGREVEARSASRLPWSAD